MCENLDVASQGGRRLLAFASQAYPREILVRNLVVCRDVDDKKPGRDGSYGAMKSARVWNLISSADGIESPNSSPWAALLLSRRRSYTEFRCLSGDISKMWRNNIGQPAYSQE